MLAYFIKALLIGMSVAAVIGPISLYFINKTLQDGVKSAGAIAIGTSLADAIYGLVAALGLSSISHFLSEYSTIFQLIGGLFLLYIAYSEIKRDTSKAVINVENSQNLMFRMFLLTLSSPITIASFLGIFASIGGGDTTVSEALVIAIGCFLGGIIWWIILGGILLKTRHKLQPKMLERIKLGSSMIIGIFGIIAIVSSLL